MDKKLDKKLDKLAMKVDMKTSHGSAREEREACAREEQDQVQAGARPGPTGRHAGSSGSRPGRSASTPDAPGPNRPLRLC
jgi:predicted transcriptional regulator